MRIPSDPKKGYSIAAKIVEILRFLKAERIVSVIGGRIVEGPNGKSLIIEPNQIGTAQAKTRLPFEISTYTTIDPNTEQTIYWLRSEPGIFGGETIVAQIEEDPADGTWYLEGELVIDDTTGSITGATVYWTDTQGTDTATEFYTTIATIEVITDKPSVASIAQYQYGPIVAIVHGGIDDVWDVTFF